jgi:RNA 2',3'-cyclic 3'-phosphodiesterase
VSRAATVEEHERLRLFLALRLPDDVRAALGAWAHASLADAGRPLPNESLHVTLAFLGLRPAHEVPTIVEALRAAAATAAPIELAVAGWRETRSVGMVVLADRDGAAATLAADLGARLERLAVYRPEARAWLPHVTVLRFRQRPRLRPELPAVRTFVPSDAAAYLSRLHPSGARYEVLQAVPLVHQHTEEPVGRS